MWKGGEVGMTDREKVMLAVSHCLRSNDCSICEACPYNESNDYGCRARLRDDIVALLKVQEPKVMTWEEAQANVQDGPFIIFEVRDSTGSEVDFGVLVGDFYEMSEGSVLTVADFWMMKDDYGKRFRLWTSRPDQATREAIPWE